ncbi:MAG: hypothetical protein CMB47_07030 [Euryarchaeota archaeon]|nr:hypothetical protein [Euryarchaeota archaeon]|tara:strand:+ start:3903 stop:4145 length:243 start_codon:yes stop_codon:yes gene_type:complete
MISTTIYLLISIGFYFIAIWWLYNHFDTVFNMQLKMHDEIIEKLLNLDNRVSLIENSDGIQIEIEQEKTQTSLDNFYGEE